MSFHDWFSSYPLDSLDSKSQSHTVERTRQKGVEREEGILYPAALFCRHGNGDLEEMAAGS